MKYCQNLHQIFTTGTLFAILLVKIAVVGGCDGGRIEMDTENITHEKLEREDYYGDPGKSRTIRFLIGNHDPTIAPVLSGSMAYLEFDVYWRQTYAVSLISLSYFSKYVKVVKDSLEKSEQETLVFPLREWCDSENSGTDICPISSFTEKDHQLASILLSISSLYVDLVIVKPDVGSNNENEKCSIYRVETTLPIAYYSGRHPLVKQLSLKYPSHFVGANSKWALDEKSANKLLVFVISFCR